MFLFIGTSTADGSSRGIYAVPFDETTGAMGAPRLAAETPNPTFLALAPGHRILYSVSEFEPLVAGFAVAAAQGGLIPLTRPADVRSKAPSHLAIDATGRLAVFSHYHSGYLGAVSIGADGTVGRITDTIRHSTHRLGFEPARGTNPQRQDGPHVHSAVFSPDNTFVAVCDLGLDKVYRYRVGLADGSLTPEGEPLSCAAGSGPRHSVFSPDGKYLYVVNELNATIAAYDLHAGTTAVQVVSTLPASYTGPNLCAEIRMSADSRYVYTTNRGHDSIALFHRDKPSGRLDLVELVPCGGRHPRHFSISPDGRWVVCANRDTSSLTAFSRDRATGRLTAANGPREVPLPVCVVFL